jgi:SAM-dependent methyltransferase
MLLFEDEYKKKPNVPIPGPDVEMMFLVTVLFTVIAFASPLRLTHVVFPAGDYLMFGEINLRRGPWFFIQGFLMVLAFLVVIPGIMYLLIAFFAVFGGTVGQSLKPFKPLKGYGINLVGSLAGIVAFTLLSFWCSPPWVWIVVGFIAGLPFFVKDWRVVLSFALVVVAVAFSHPRTYWSPYYRIELKELLPPEGWNKPTGYFLTVNHDYHQMMLNLSSEFLTRYPGAEPYQSALSNYELPYKVVHHPERVLVVGAGTGNDVAAALRHGARHIDAVEIDPVILDLGRRYHPERPYDSDRVTVHVDDARAYFHQCRQKYDVIVFGYLDSHTLLTSMSSVRLDNYVYTLESFREARALLAKGGVIALAFSSGKSFVGDRMFATLSRAFGVPARAYFTENAQSGVAYFEGENLNTSDITEFPEISSEFQSRMARVTLATDHSCISSRGTSHS